MPSTDFAQLRTVSNEIGNIRNGRHRETPPRRSHVLAVA
jgi:hypothetical protein